MRRRIHVKPADDRIKEMLYPVNDGCSIRSRTLLSALIRPLFLMLLLPPSGCKESSTCKHDGGMTDRFEDSDSSGFIDSCAQETDQEFCIRLGHNCGLMKVPMEDNCGEFRTADCGECSAPEVCGGSGEKYVCGIGPCEETVFPDGTWVQVEAPTTAALKGVWGGAADDVWAVGEGGVILHWDGDLWSETAGPVSEDIYDIHGTAPTSVWAVGDFDGALHWDGSEWSLRDSGLILGPLYTVWSAGPDLVWAGGKDPGSTYGTSFLWDGAQWTFHQTWSDIVVHISGLTISDPAETYVWAVTAEGGLMAWDGGEWGLLPMVGIEITGHIAGLWAAAADDLWLVGSDIHRWDGQTLTTIASGRLPYQSMQDIAAFSADEIWAVGYAWYHFSEGEPVCGLVRHWNGADWQLTENKVNVPLHSVAAPPGSSDVWAVGSAGTILRLNR